jgi:hypothetical protein
VWTIARQTRTPANALQCGGFRQRPDFHVRVRGSLRL